MKVLIPSALRSYTEHSVAEANGATLAAVLADLDHRYAGIRFRMIDEQERIRPHIRIFINGEQVRDLFGPPYQSSRFARLDRNVWTWHMRRFGDPGIPVQLNVQMSPDGVVREVVILDESDSVRDGVALSTR